MEFFLEAVLQFLFEVLLQLLVEVFAEIGFQSIAEVFKRRQVQNPWAAGLGHFLLGAAAGGISLMIFRATLIRSPSVRVVNLVLTPVLVGLVMFSIGRLRQKKGRELVRLDRFGYGFLFAFGMALVRFWYATRPA
jgi:hypothetical protein